MLFCFCCVISSNTNTATTTINIYATIFINFILIITANVIFFKSNVTINSFFLLIIIYVCCYSATITTIDFRYYSVYCALTD
jgi:hypothetical protein